MNSIKILFPAFILVALVQLYVPAKMIWNREEVLNTGTEYKFRTAPIDPNDPFRGKYIILSFQESTVGVANGQDWETGETVYTSLTTDHNGFSKIKAVSKEKPAGSQDYIKAKVSFVADRDSTRLTIDYPFDRFYMEESKAYDAELTYIQSQRDTTKTTYALVRVKNGTAVVKDVLIGGTSIREIVKANQEKNRK